VEALKRGADIIISGRTTDAGAIQAFGSWWHDWKDTDLDNLALTLVTGHIIECGTYAVTITAMRANFRPAVSSLASKASKVTTTSLFPLPRSTTTVIASLQNNQHTMESSQSTQPAANSYTKSKDGTITIPMSSPISTPSESQQTEKTG
jgi:hypothetical protein